MLPFLSMLALALAVSLDGFGVGASYGLRKIKIPLTSVVIIALLSGVVMFVSMHIGGWLAACFSPRLAKMMGSIILIGIGIWAVRQMLRQEEAEEERDAGTQLAAVPAVQADAEPVKNTLLSIEFKRLGLVIQILRTPSAADVDRSGVISPSEAALLGIALSLDAFGAGIGAAFIGFSPLWTAAVISAASGSFIYAGLRLGFRVSHLPWIRRFSIVPGCMLILIGLIKMM